MSIRLFNNSGGYIDLDAGGDGTAANTFTLPAETGTVLTSASSLDATTLTGNVAASRIITALNATGSAPFYACRAWVNFDGTTNVGGFCTIRESGNVSSVADNGTGDYTINFATAMPDANYCVTGCGGPNVSAPSTATAGTVITPFTRTTSPYTVAPSVNDFRFTAINNPNNFTAGVDTAYIHVAVFR